MKSSLSMTGFPQAFPVFILLFAATMVSGQVSQTQRFEREQKNSDDYYNIISLKGDGLALFRERDKYKANNQLWELTLLDTAL
jgi:hypothetical protein